MSTLVLRPRVPQKQPSRLTPRAHREPKAGLPSTIVAYAIVCVSYTSSHGRVRRPRALSGGQEPRLRPDQPGRPSKSRAPTRSPVCIVGQRGIVGEHEGHAVHHHQVDDRALDDGRARPGRRRWRPRPTPGRGSRTAGRRRSRGCCSPMQHPSRIASTISPEVIVGADDHRRLAHRLGARFRPSPLPTSARPEHGSVVDTVAVRPPPPGVAGAPRPGSTCPRRCAARIALHSRPSASPIVHPVAG